MRRPPHRYVPDIFLFIVEFIVEFYRCLPDVEFIIGEICRWYGISVWNNLMSKRKYVK